MVAQVSKPAVLPVSPSAECGKLQRHHFLREPAGLETRDTSESAGSVNGAFPGTLTKSRVVLALALFCMAWLTVSNLPACELCAIYSANNAREDSGRGFTFTIAEQYVSAHNLQFEGEPAIAAPFFQSAFLDSAYTHLVPGYNLSSRFGVSLNAPIIYRNFRRTQQFQPSGDIVDESGSITGLGDLALIGRLTLFRQNTMKYSLNVNLLAGVKFPTGDTDRLDDEVTSALADEAMFGPTHQHGAVGGVHQHDLTLGSGSYDAVFGITPSFRWRRWFVNNQSQYYLRTEGHGYQFGDMVIISGGPGAYILLGEDSTLSLQANAFYERNARDKIIGQTFNQTGMTAWYLGPLINFTLGEHFSANAGVDVPLSIYNHGLQTVPDYRVHGGFSWRF